MKNYQFCAVRMQKACNTRGYTNTPLSVQININPTRRALATFKVCIFNHDLFPLGQAYCESRKTSGKSKDDEGNPVTHLTFEVESEYCWFPGQYIAVLYQGATPQCHCQFELSEKSDEVACASLECYKKGTEDYLAARDLYQSEFFCHLPYDCSRSHFKQQLAAIYARECADASLAEVGLGKDELGVEVRKIFGITLSEEERSQRSRNLTIRVIDDREIAAMYAITCAMPRFGYPLKASGVREVWNIRDMLEHPERELPDVAEGTTVIIRNAKYFYEGGPAGTEIAQQLLVALENRKYADNRFILCAQQTVIDQLFSRYPGFLIDFPERNHLTINNEPTLTAYCKRLFSELNFRHFELTLDVKNDITNILYTLWSQRKHLDISKIDALVDDVMQQHACRLVQETSEKDADQKSNARRLCYEDFEAVLLKQLPKSIDLDYMITDESGNCHAEQCKESNLLQLEELVNMDHCEALQTLRDMTGLQRVKDEVDQAITLARFSALRKHFRLEEEGKGRHHMLFMGNPGTGKTTVAKLIGEIYHNMGILSCGHTVVCDRSTLVGRYIGESENNVREIIEKAHGGVLFVDEAYTLCANDDERDFGHKVLECMLPVLAEPNPDMLVIFAGYEDKFTGLFRANPGLRDRFPLTFHFDNYTVDELLDIIRGMAIRKQFTLAPVAEERLRCIISETLQKHDPHFSNARWATNLFENGIVTAMANRVMSNLKTVQDERALFATLTRAGTLTEISEADVRMAEAQYIQCVAPREPETRRIGFLSQCA